MNPRHQNNNEEHRRIAIAKVVAVAQRVLSGQQGIVSGARQLASLRFDVDADRDPDFVFFVGVDSETDDLPLEGVRSQWDADAFKAKQTELLEFESKVRRRRLGFVSG